MVARRATVAVLSVLLSGPMVAGETTRYISDQLSVAVRAGPGPRQRVLEMLPAGQVVQWLADGAGGYSQIQTPGGKTGWVLGSELMSTPPARLQLAALQREPPQTERVQTELRQTQLALQKLQAHNQQQLQELAELRQAAAQPQQLLQENQALRARHQQLTHERDLLAQEVQSLRQRGAQDWFMIGAGVLLAGILLGVALPRLGRVRHRGDF